MNDGTIRFGYPEEWEKFKVRHQRFLDCHGGLLRLVEGVFLRTWESREPIDRVVFFLGRTCLEDFSEIVLLCGNGYGLGASKLVRGMFERALLARHLHDNPQEVDRFLDFYWIGEKTILREIERVHGSDAVPEENRQRTNDEYERVKGDFMVTLCEKCGTQRPNHSWTKLDIASIAQRYPLFRSIIVEAYMMPTQQVHGTVRSFTARGRATVDGIEFDGGFQTTDSEVALISAHNLLLDVLDLQINHFTLTSHVAAIDACRDDFVAAWKDHGFARRGI